MDEKTIKKPYAVYDILGYLIPGGVLCLGVVVLGWALWGTVPSFNWGAHQAKEVWPQNWYEFATVIVVALFMLYVIGHVVALLSAMVIDSFVIKRIHGYPFHTMLKRLFPLTRFQLYKKLLSVGAHAYMVLACILLSLPSVSIEAVIFTASMGAWLMGCRLTFACYPRTAESGVHAIILLSRFVGFSIILMVYGLWGIMYLLDRVDWYSVLGKLVNVIGVVLPSFRFSLWVWVCGILLLCLFALGGAWLLKVGRPTAGKMSLRKAYENQLDDLWTFLGDDRKATKLVACSSGDSISLLQYALLGLAVVPCFLGCLLYYILSKPLYAITGIYRPMSDAFVNRFCESCKKLLFGGKAEDCEVCNHKQDLYWLTACFLTEHTEKHNLNIKHWLSLYGFARNLGMAFFLLFLIGAIARRVFYEHSVHPVVVYWPLVMGVLAALLLHRYVYLYYKYYSKYIARAFVSEAMYMSAEAK